jgi:hypothetical protein
MGPNCLVRGTSLVAPQALHMLNDKMIHQLSLHFASQIRQEVGTDPSVQVKHVYLNALGRSPTAEENNIGVTALKQLTEKWKLENPENKEQTDFAQKSLANYCHAVFNLAEFQYID